MIFVVDVVVDVVFVVVFVVVVVVVVASFFWVKKASPTECWLHIGKSIRCARIP